MFYEPVKRIVDFTGAVVLSIIFAPVAFITACAIKMDTPGPIFADIPERAGKDGKPFKLFKFRSMIVGSHDRIRTDPKMRKLFEVYKRSNYKLSHDPRVTHVGKFIRKHSIDEIPQLINVLKGDMSIVGPRPYHFDELEVQTRNFPRTKKMVKEMLTVKPGITGPWQVSGRSEVDFDKRIELDALYARKKSIVGDFVILFKSPWAMISGKGAV